MTASEWNDAIFGSLERQMQGTDKRAYEKALSDILQCISLF